MTTPNALILAKFKDDATYEAKILSLFKDCPHITLENKGKIEMDVFKDYALKIRLHIFEAATKGRIGMTQQNLMELQNIVRR